MAFPELAKAGTVPPLYRLHAEGHIPRNMFAFWLRPMNTQDWGASGGEVELGGFSQHRFTGNLSWLPILRRPYWELAMPLARLNLTGASEYAGKAVIDSGTSLIVTPIVIAAEINEALGGTYSTDTGYYMLNCSQIQKLPSLLLYLGSQGLEFELRPQDYIIQYMNECYSAISGMDIETRSGPVWILGDAFLRRFYAIFDADAEQVGLALRADDDQSESK